MLPIKFVRPVCFSAVLESLSEICHILFTFAMRWDIASGRRKERHQIISAILKSGCVHLRYVNWAHIYCYIIYHICTQFDGFRSKLWDVWKLAQKDTGNRTDLLSLPASTWPQRQTLTLRVVSSTPWTSSVNHVLSGWVGHCARVASEIRIESYENAVQSSGFPHWSGHHHNQSCGTSLGGVYPKLAQCSLSLHGVWICMAPALPTNLTFIASDPCIVFTPVHCICALLIFCEAVKLP